MFARLFVLVCACALCMPASAQPLATLHPDLDAAQAFDYCAWAFGAEPDTTGLAQLRAWTSSEYEGAVDPLYRAGATIVTAGVQVARASDDAEACMAAIDRGQKVYGNILRFRRGGLENRQTYDRSDDPAIAAVQDSLAQLWVDDQAARSTLLQLSTEDTVGAAYWGLQIARARTSAIDVRSTRYMEHLMTEYDWIDSHRFGDRISQHAWLLVQHADAKPAVQRLALERMEPHLATGGVQPGNYAYLWDRVAVNAGQLQRYGTQPTWECTDDGLVLAPLENPDAVDERRADMGLGPVAESLAEMTAAVCQG